MRRVVLAALLVVLPVAACGEDDEAPVVAGSDPTTTTTEAPADGAQDGPPAIEISGGEHDLAIDPWSFCWSSPDGRGVCADGMPPDVLPDAGASDELLLTFPAATDDWVFQATIGDPCGGETADLERVDGTSWRIAPLGTAGTNDVQVFGRGSGGDVIASFTWTTTEDGAFTQPSGTASIVADHDGEMDSYGVEVGVSHLRDDEVVDASGTVVVTSSSGASHAIELRRRDEITCSRSVHLGAPTDEGVAAAALDGGPPFTYEVTLTLDGATYVGRGTWPDDVDEECSPCVPLTFDPPLPARGPATG